MKNNKITNSAQQVAVIGNAKLTDPILEEKCIALGYALSLSGYSIICGGLGGVMEAVCRGFKKVEKPVGQTVGILPSYDRTTANPYIDIVIPTGLDIGRNQIVVASGLAVIAIGGGAGTLSEIALASQINKPIILLKGSGGWSDHLDDEFLDQRKNAPLYHAKTVEAIISHLNTLSTVSKIKAGYINSGHNR